ncbi:uncharacterized protein LOC143575654 [Bidens hawaiensis]|uniref:uncharacterized protein LOC143575654 n=1 Tax=Bidens hawaiensis TaxID=980011 RepID=UPI00404AB8CD
MAQINIRDVLDQDEVNEIYGRAVSDVLLNNMCEQLNSKLLDGRDKPIITALEFIREYLMRRIVNVLKVIDRSDGLLTPYATNVLETIKKEAAKYFVIWNGGEHFQVSGPFGDQRVVDLGQRLCACRRWEITGIPCRHTVAAMWSMQANGKQCMIPEKLVNPIYMLETWKKVYSFKVFPINGWSMWPRSQVPTILVPPNHHKPIGRPKKVRKKSITELEDITKGNKLSKKNSTMTCSKCKQKGHNIRSCTSQQA